MPLLDEGISQADHEAELTSARAQAHAEGLRQGTTDGQTAGAAAAYTRISTILGNPKVKGKEGLAVELACQSPQMSADAVVNFIDRVPAANARPPLAERIDATGANTVAPGTTGGGQSGNAGLTEEQRQRAEAATRARTEAAASVNAERGFGRSAQQ